MSKSTDCSFLWLPLILGCTDPETVPSALTFSGDIPSNVLIISVDTLRRDRLGRYDGSGRTPNIDKLLSDGVVFDDHRSCSSWTYASVLCVLSGAYNLEMGYTPIRDLEVFDNVPASVTTLAEALDQREASLFSTNSFLGTETGLGRGYQSKVVDLNLTTSAEDLIDMGLAEIDDSEGSWLVHLHFMDAHLPYSPPLQYLKGLDALQEVPYDLTVGDDVNGLAAVLSDWSHLSEGMKHSILQQLKIYYNGEVAYLDDQIGRMLSELTQRGLINDTLILFWSDHGEQHFDHDGIRHGKSLYAEENYAVVGFSNPGLLPATITAPTTHRDIAPTLLAGMQREIPDSMTGRVVTENHRPEARFSVVLSNQATFSFASVDEDSHRLIYNFEGGVELYDTENDPLEMTPLKDQDVIDELWELLAPRVLEYEGLPGASAAVLP